MIKLVVSTTLALLLAGCASAPRVTTSANPAADFSSFRTYNFMLPLSTDRSGVQTPMSAMLVEAMSAEMASRGFKRSNTPDLLINFFVLTEERMDVRQTSGAGSFHSYRRNRYRGWPNYRTEVRQYTVGTLAVDVVDAAQSMLAWEAIAQQRVGSSGAGLTQERANEVLAQVMEEFPGRAN
jgi:hypothetical protein